MDEPASLLAAYFHQQAQLDMPAYIFSDAAATAAVLGLRNLAKDRPAQRKPSDAAPLHPAHSAIASARPPFRKPPALPLPAHKLMPAYTTPSSAHSSAPSTEKRLKLAQLFHEVKVCQKCDLGKKRATLVFGAGNPDALFMVVGEAPGAEEDAQGLPFVGAAGELLTRMLSAIAIDRKKHAFITNIVKCRPPQNRDPEPSEIQSCADILSRQIAIIAPKVILLLGKVASHALLNATESVGALRGREHAYRGIPVFVTYHPAALLRNDAYRRPAWEDLQKVRKKLEKVGVYGAPA